MIVYDDTADMFSDKKVTPIVTELFIRERKLNISLIFITQSYFIVPKNKFNRLFRYENSKQKRASTNRILQILTFNTL